MKRPMLLRLTTREYFQTLISIGISFETGLHSTLDVSGLTLTFKLAKLLSSCTSLKAQIPQHPLWLSFLIPVGRLTYLSICFYIINYPCTKGNICFFSFFLCDGAKKCIYSLAVSREARLLRFRLRKYRLMGALFICAINLSVASGKVLYRMTANPI